MLDFLFASGGAVCATLLIYGDWLCLHDGALHEPEQAPPGDLAELNNPLEKKTHHSQLSTEGESATVGERP